MSNPAPKPARPRLDDDIRARVDTYAKKTRRSFNSAVNHLLDYALDHLDEPRAKEG